MTTLRPNKHTPEQASHATDPVAAGPLHRWIVNGADLLANRTKPALMGILNVTPDSFSDGGAYTDVAAAVDHAHALVEAGADILDIGGESTRPGAEPVDAAEERRRTEPVICAIAASCDVPISIDTTKASVAAAALDAGATIVNDISGLTFDEAMISLCAERGCGVVAMHIQGTPQTMQAAPSYADVVGEVDLWLAARLEAMRHAGIDPEHVLLDPGIGFGKTAQHNLDLMRHLGVLRRRRPVLVGHSRKRFLKAVLGRDVEERLAGTLGVAIALAERGADVLRVHDVRAVNDALIAWRTVATDA